MTTGLDLLSIISMFQALNQLNGHSAHNAFTGGSFAISDPQSNTVMKMFAPGAEIQPPSTPILDPFTAKLRTRYEIPDTSKTVNLGEFVMFTTLTNKENFMTRDIYPLVDWGWSVRTFGWSIWNFPQHPVRPTPETAPPRFLASAKIGETTQLMRFSIGQHMSNEYAKTTMGQSNQGYNLEQMEYSVQETLNLLAIQELNRCQLKHRQLLEKFGDYKVVDIETLMLKEVRQFCRPQKSERGFQTLYEEVALDMARIGGKANSAILTSRINTLILAKPEMTEYYRAGPAGPAIVANPNRSFLPNGITVYYTKSYPERFRMKESPWESITQIGGYHKSMELQVIKDADGQYLKNYTSKVRDIHIYNQETDAMHVVPVDEMIHHSHVWREDGTVRGIFEPPATNRSRGSVITPSDIDTGYSDFLSFEPEDIAHYQTLSIQDSFQDQNARDSAIYNMHADLKSITSDQLPKGLEVFGQLRPQHFGSHNVRETGEMIMYRLATLAQMDPHVFSHKISAGLRLYSEMCKHAPDLDFVNLTIKNYLWDLYTAKYTSVKEEVNANDGNKTYLTETTHGLTLDELYKKAMKAFLEQDDWLNIARLKKDLNGFLPLPKRYFPEYDTRVFNRLTGFACYGGFRSMRDAYKSNETMITKRYIMGDLKIASDFVDVMEHIAAHIPSLLPECQSFQEVLTGKKTGGEVIAEQFFNMVGIPLWVNMKKSNLFLLPDGSYNKLAGVAKDATKYHGATVVDIWNPATTSAKREALNARGEYFTDIVHASLHRFYSGESSDGSNVLETLSRMTQQRLKKYKGKTTDFTTLLSKTKAMGTTTFDTTTNYGIKSVTDVFKLLNQWIKPTVARQVGSKDAWEVKDKGSWLADTTTVAIPKLKLSEVRDANYGVAVGLALSSPFLEDDFMCLFGPLRLQLYGLVLQAMILACGLNDDSKVLEAFLKFNSLMLPFFEAEKVYDGDTVNAALAFSASNNLIPLKRNDASVGVLTNEYKLAAARKAAYHSGSDGIPGIAQAFKTMLTEVFGDVSDSRLQADIRNIMTTLAEAERTEAKYEAKLTSFVTKTTKTSLNLPFLEYLGLHGEDAQITIDNPNTTTLDVYAKTFIEEKLSKVLGLRLSDSAEDYGFASQAMIGGRGGSTLHRLGMGSPHVTVDDMADDNNFSFVLTPLVISADQVDDLFNGKNAPNMCKQIFDVRVGQPYDPSKYVPIDGQQEYLRNVKAINTKAIKSQYDVGSGGGTYTFHWVDVPMLRVDKRTKITFFGPSFRRGHFNRHQSLSRNHKSRRGGTGVGAGGVSDSNVVTLPVVAGIRMSSFFTKSFVRVCNELDNNCLNDLERCLALCWMTTSFTRQSFHMLQKRNIRIPMNFLIVRPHANYLMEKCAILAPGVNDLGFMAIAGKDYTTGFTTLTKEMYGHLSFWASPITMHPQNCRIIQNLMCIGYGHGGGVDWYDPVTYNPHKVCNTNKPQNGSESLMCLAIPFTENITRQYIVTSGRLQHIDEGYGSSSSVAKQKGDDVPHFNTYMRYNFIWKWRDPKDSQLMQNMGNTGTYPLYNKICWSGFTLYNDTTSSTPKYATLNKGHWGENEGPTCQAIREGAVEVFPNFEYNKKYHIVA